ncbi:MAG: FAD-binding oxidoreductase, partial [Nitrospirales bacterium]
MENLPKPSMYHVTLKKRQEVAKGTMAFYFDRPATFTFKAGQFIDLSLPNLSASDPQGNTRVFTLASAPSEQQLMVATRIRNTTFKRMLREMPLETTIDIEGPFGQFT